MSNPIHDLYRKALAADEHYSKVLTEHGASRWETRTVRMARSAAAQYQIRQAYQAKLEADIDYHNACKAEGTGY